MLICRLCSSQKNYQRKFVLYDLEKWLRKEAKRAGSNHPQPPRDLIATVPIAALSELQIQLSGYFTNINTIIDNIDNIDSNSQGNVICQAASDSTTLTIPVTTVGDDVTGEFKNKKYSIQKIFDNNNE